MTYYASNYCLCLECSRAPLDLLESPQCWSTFFLLSCHQNCTGWVGCSYFVLFLCNQGFTSTLHFDLLILNSSFFLALEYVYSIQNNFLKDLGFMQMNCANGFLISGFFTSYLIFPFFPKILWTNINLNFKFKFTKIYFFKK